MLSELLEIGDFDLPFVITTDMLRVCLDCGKEFPSIDSADRVCQSCKARERDARARPFADTQARRYSDLISDADEYFDTDFLLKRRNDNNSRNGLRRQRQRSLGIYKGDMSCNENELHPTDLPHSASEAPSSN